MSDLYSPTQLYTFTGADGQGVYVRSLDIGAAMECARRALGMPEASHPFDQWTQVAPRDFIQKDRKNG